MRCLFSSFVLCSICFVSHLYASIVVKISYITVKIIFNIFVANIQCIYIGA